MLGGRSNERARSSTLGAAIASPALDGPGEEAEQMRSERCARRLEAGVERRSRSRAIRTGRGAAWSAHLLWEQGVAGSNPAVPTTSTNPLLSRGADGPSLG